MPISAQRDATTVLSHSTFGRYFRPKPMNTVVEPLRCFNLGLVGHPYYHGHGGSRQCWTATLGCLLRC
jgi:hypothetical protein